MVLHWRLFCVQPNKGLLCISEHVIQVNDLNKLLLATTSRASAMAWFGAPRRAAAGFSADWLTADIARGEDWFDRRAPGHPACATA